MTYHPKKVTEEYDAQIPELIEAGYTIREISKELGISYEGARNAISRRGLKAKPEINNYKTIHKSMSKDDAIQYLLDCVEVLEGVGSIKIARNRWGFHVTIMQARILHTLEARSPSIISKTSLYDAMYFDVLHDDPPEPKIVDVQVCKIRKAMPESFGKIHTAWGEGYWLELAEKKE